VPERCTRAGRTVMMSRGLLVKFRTCEMCDVLIVVDPHARHGFCSAECRARYDRIGCELDKMVAHLRQALGDHDRDVA
jgi:hypothetical protein